MPDPERSQRPCALGHRAGCTAWRDCFAPSPTLVAATLIVLVTLATALLPAAALGVEVRAEHPRVLLTPERLQRLQTSTRPGGTDAPLYAALRAHGETLIDTRRRDGGRSTVRLLALLYAVEKDGRYLRTALRVFNEMGTTTNGKPHDRKIRARLEAAAYLYDWGYGGLDQATRDQLAKIIAQDAAMLREQGFLSLDGVLGGHHLHAHKSSLIGWLALANDRPAAAAKLETLRGNIFEHYLPFLAYMAGDDGGLHMGFEYSRYYHGVAIEILDAWRTATGEDGFKRFPWLAKAGLFHLFGLKDDHTHFMAGDTGAPSPSEDTRLVLRKIAVEYGAPYAAWGERLLSDWEVGTGAEDRIFDLLWGAPTPTDQAPAPPVERAHLFERAGIALMREHWDLARGTSGVTALFKSTPTYFVNHSHRDVNTFELAFGGNLALDSGYYDSYKSNHWRHYYTQTVAHNGILLKRAPTERIGQKTIKGPRTIDDVKSGRFEVGGIVEFEDTPLYTYVSGQGAKAYPDGLLNDFQRHFLYLREGSDQAHPIAVVYDDIKVADPLVQAVWLLHAEDKPTEGANTFALINARARLDGFVVEPRPGAAETRLVGGPDQAFWTADRNVPPQGTIPDGVTAGHWRLEVTHPVADRQRFLVVMVPTLGKGPATVEVARLTVAAAVGVRIGKTRVLFPDDGAMATMTLPPAAGTERTLIVGLAPHATFKVDGGAAAPIVVRTSAAGVLELNAIGAPDGTIVLTRH